MKDKNVVSPRVATLIGLSAIVLWSGIVGLIRGVSQDVGPTGGAALIYSGASVLLLMTVGLQNVRSFPRRYLLWGSLLFVSYELCLALSIGYAATSQQAIEVGMVNYLWPALTLIFAILFNKQRSTWLVVPGFLIAIGGICVVLGGEDGLQIGGILRNLQSNPASYGLALLGAVIWSTYCTVTARIANGKNGVTLFFLLTAIALWVKYGFSNEQPLALTQSGVLYLIGASMAMGFGYAAWNIGLLHGRIPVLVGCSYFIPVLSAMLSALILHTALSGSFWRGAAMVCLGSVLCWVATRSDS
ncbi:aromatic amino acid DMT transporter YddG [Xanthomonas citri]|uniref:aromatic amino acid DMT transporter YddG n=1 Tax=Xanthomonas citri TaxID=346 RepID=UPI000C07C11D|nr:aromatic amino acid DMT transporter YddG [Xanthomonas citri]